MIIKKIVLNNFRQYKGKQAIRMSTKKDKNVTVILGKNTSGKTTLIEAFKWCLYDQTTYKKGELINAEIESEMGLNSKEEVFVEITLIHNDTEYIIKRTQNYRKNKLNSVVLSNSELNILYKEESGELKSIREIERQNTINSMLPKELSDYFFFDGERIGDIGRRSDMKSAVQGLMGLDVVTEAKNRLDSTRKSSVTSAFESELDTGSEIENKKIEEERNKLQDELTKKREEVEQLEDNILEFTDLEKKLSNKILSNRDAERDQKRKLKLENDIVTLERRINTMKIGLKKSISKDALYYFAIPLIEKSEKVLDNSTDDLEAVEGMSAKAIDYLINRGECICGCNITENESALSNLESEKKLLPPYHIGTMINQHKREYKRMLDDGWKFQKDIVDDFKRLQLDFDDLDDKKQEIKELSERNKENLDIGQLERERVELLNRIKTSEHRKTQLYREIGSIEEKLKLIIRKREDSLKSTKKNAELKLCIEYCNEIYAWFDETYKREEKEVKVKLEKNVNEIFNKMYHGKRKVEIDDDYSVSLRTELDDIYISTDESKGLEAVKNFSFVAGLVKLAKEKVQDQVEMERNDIYIEEPYPLIMDAPFSNVDELHIDNIVKILPDVAEQVVIILMKKDWNYAKESLAGKIGHIYDIIKVENKETESLLKERKDYV